jgi:hypothetical protein
MHSVTTRKTFVSVCARIFSDGMSNDIGLCAFDTALASCMMCGMTTQRRQLSNIAQQKRGG